MWTAEGRQLRANGNEVSAASHRSFTGLRFGEWQVCWLGGWSRDRLSYLVMVVKTTHPTMTRTQNDREGNWF